MNTEEPTINELMNDYGKNYYLKNKVRLKAQMKEYRSKNKERINLKNTIWRSRNKEKTKIKNTIYYQQNKQRLDIKNDKYRKAHLLQVNQKTRERSQKFKLKIYAHYSPELKCVCCGENTLQFLSIDHVEGDGNKHRRIIGQNAVTLYRWIIRNNYPKNFQILCMNCNFGRRMNKGICPHKSKGEITSTSKP